jgi:hypothetical protein
MDLELKSTKSALESPQLLDILEKYGDTSPLNDFDNEHSEFGSDSSKQAHTAVESNLMVDSGRFRLGRSLARSKSSPGLEESAWIDLWIHANHGAEKQPEWFHRDDLGKDIRKDADESGFSFLSGHPLLRLYLLLYYTTVKLYNLFVRNHCDAMEWVKF